MFGSARRPRWYPGDRRRRVRVRATEPPDAVPVRPVGEQTVLQRGTHRGEVPRRTGRGRCRDLIPRVSIVVEASARADRITARRGGGRAIARRQRAATGDTRQARSPSAGPRTNLSLPLEGAAGSTARGRTVARWWPVPPR